MNQFTNLCFYKPNKKERKKLKAIFSGCEIQRPRGVLHLPVSVLRPHRPGHQGPHPARGRVRSRVLSHAKVWFLVLSHDGKVWSPVLSHAKVWFLVLSHAKVLYLVLSHAKVWSPVISRQSLISSFISRQGLIFSFISRQGFIFSFFSRQGLIFSFISSFISRRALATSWH